MDLAQFIKATGIPLDGGMPDTPWPSNLALYRRNAVSDLESHLYEPVYCLVLQGSKMTSVGRQSAAVRPGDGMLVSHHLPVLSRITDARPDAPYIALVLTLDLGLLRRVYAQIADTLIPDDDAQSLAIAPGTPDLLEPLARYVNLASHPLDAQVLGEAYLFEIHYRLLLSPAGGMLRNLLSIDSHASRISKAISEIRAGFRAPLAVPDLARTVGMSPSSFHEHFKAVTGTTPLQYHKDLRLLEAKSLLTDGTHSVSSAAFAVGYESPTHFSRDYSRRFGNAPSTEAQTLSV